MPRGSRRIHLNSVDSIPADWTPVLRGNDVMPPPEALLNRAHALVSSALGDAGFEWHRGDLFVARPGDLVEVMQSVTAWRISGATEPNLFIGVRASWTQRSPFVVRLGRRIKGTDAIYWHPHPLVNKRFGSKFDAFTIAMPGNATLIARAKAQWSWLVDADREGSFAAQMTPAASICYAVALCRSLRSRRGAVLDRATGVLLERAKSGADNCWRPRDVLIAVLEAIAASYVTRSAASEAAMNFIARAYEENVGGIRFDLPSIAPGPLLAKVEAPRPPVGGEAVGSPAEAP